MCVLLYCPILRSILSGFCSVKGEMGVGSSLSPTSHFYLPLQSPTSLGYYSIGGAPPWMIWMGIECMQSIERSFLISGQSISNILAAAVEQALLRYQGRLPRRPTQVEIREFGIVPTWLLHGCLLLVMKDTHQRDQAFPNADPSPGYLVSLGAVPSFLSGATPFFTALFVSLSPNQRHPIQTQHLFHTLSVYAWNYQMSISAFLLKQPFLEACMLYNLR